MRACICAEEVKMEKALYFCRTEGIDAGELRFFMSNVVAVVAVIVVVGASLVGF